MTGPETRRWADFHTRAAGYSAAYWDQEFSQLADAGH
jgi:hypothetical protein